MFFVNKPCQDVYPAQVQQSALPAITSHMLSTAPLSNVVAFQVTISPQDTVSVIQVVSTQSNLTTLLLALPVIQPIIMFKSYQIRVAHVTKVFS